MLPEGAPPALITVTTPLPVFLNWHGFRLIIFVALLRVIYFDSSDCSSSSFVYCIYFYLFAILNTVFASHVT